MNIVFYVFKDIFVPIFIAIITFFSTFFINRKIERPRLLLTYMKFNKEDSIDMKKSIIKINEIFADQRIFENELKKLLINKGYNKIFFKNELIRELLKYYNKEINFKYDEEIRNILRCFKEDKKFLILLKKYQIYEVNSSFLIKLTNLGKTNAYDFKIINVNNEYSKIIKMDENFEVNDTKLLQINYFDNTIKINNFFINFSDELEYGFSKRKQLIFYLVKKKRYNNIDEKLFEINYKDRYLKEYKYYVCAKIVNKK